MSRPEQSCSREPEPEQQQYLERVSDLLPRSCSREARVEVEEGQVLLLLPVLVSVRGRLPKLPAG